MRIPALSRTPLRLVLAMLTFVGSLGGALAEDIACPGKSQLAEIEAEQPEVWKAALAEFDAIPNSTGLFWKIEKDGIDPSWLLGTIHVPATGVTAFRPAIVEAFDRSDRLVLESTEIFDEGKLQLAAAIAEFARYPTDDQSFDATFTKEEKDALGAMTAAVGMPYFAARHFKPWFMVLSLMIPPCAQIATLQGKLGVDARLREDALAMGKPVLGLETRDEQLEALKSLAQAGYGPDHLRAIIAFGSKELEDQWATQIELYLQERPALGLVLGFHLPAYELWVNAYRNAEGALVHERNLRFRDRLRPLLQEGGAFVAVGALHLIDSDGLVELLRAEGYEVTRVE